MPKQIEKILVAEGDADVMDLIARQVLEPMGYTVGAALNGPAALQMAVKLQPEIILAALDLPGLSGTDLLTALRSQGSHAYVIAMGAPGEEHHLLQAFRLGARDYLTKPIREAELVTALDRALEELRLRREREQLAQKLGVANQQLEKRIKELTTLYGIGKAVSAVTDLTQLIARLMEGALQVTEGELAWLLLAEDGKSDRLILRAVKNIPPLAGIKLNQPWDDGLSSMLMLSGEGITIAGDPLSRMKAGQVARAVVASPIKAKDQVLGVLVVGNKTGKPFVDRDQAMLSAVADYASVALINARLFQEVEARAQRLQKAYEDLSKGHPSGGASTEMALRLARELDTRLTQSRAALEPILRGATGHLNQKQNEALRVGLEWLNASIRLVEDFTAAVDPSKRPASR
jgi:two-component system NtrC family sensor kinase